MNPHVRRPLGELLVEVRLLPREVVDQALLEQTLKGGRLGELLVAQGYLSPRDVWRALALQLDLPWVSLRNHPPQPLAMQLLAASDARQMGVLPLSLVGEGGARRLTVAVVEPQRQALVPTLEKQLGLQVTAVLCDPAELREALDWYDAFPVLGTLVGQPAEQLAPARGIPPPVELAPIQEITAPAARLNPALEATAPGGLSSSPLQVQEPPQPVFSPASLAPTLPPLPAAPARVKTPLPSAVVEAPPAATRDEVTALRRRVKDLERTVQRLAGQMESMLELRLRLAQIESREEQLRSRLQTAVIRLPTSFGDVSTARLQELEEEPGLTTMDEDDVESPTLDAPEEGSGPRTNLFAQLLAEAGVSGVKPEV
jgi:hypothetical protein